MHEEEEAAEGAHPTLVILTRYVNAFLVAVAFTGIFCNT